MKRKRTVIVLAVVTLLIAGATFKFRKASAQPQQPTVQENRYVVIPPESVLLFVASQPGCPIRFEDMKLLVRVDRRDSTVFGKIHNAVTKPIRYLSIGLGGSGGGISTVGGPGPMSGAAITDLLMPGQDLADPSPPQIVPLTEELKHSLELDARSPKGFFVLMVLSVTFADGTKYTDERNTKSIEKYLEFISNTEEAGAKTNQKRLTRRR